MRIPAPLLVFKRKLAAKIFLITVLIITVISTSFTAVFFLHQRQLLSKNLVHQGLTLADYLSAGLKLGVLTENPDFLRPSIEVLSQTRGVGSVSVYGADGGLLAHWGEPDSSSAVDLKETHDVLSSTLKSFFVDEPDHVTFWAPVLSRGVLGTDDIFFFGQETEPERHVIGSVRFDISKEIMAESVKSLIKKSIILALVSIGCGFLVAFLAARRITRPLKVLSKGVETISTGNFASHVAVETEDEIGELAAEFNRMADMLKKRDEEKQRLMEQLSQSERLAAVEYLAGGIAHDFNNILSIVQNNMELAKPKAPEYIRAYVERALKASKRGGKLVSTLMEFAQEPATPTSAVNLDTVVRETLDFFKSTDSRITVSCWSGEDLWKVRGDAGQLQQVVMNLFVNARDAVIEQMERGDSPDYAPSIDVSLSNSNISEADCREHIKAVPGEYMVLTVSDNGTGMDGQTVQHVFEPFFTTKKVGTGTGLGMSTVYGIVNRHGGWIDVKSSPGMGTTFRVYLPKTYPLPVEHEPPGPSLNVPSGHETVLLVEDEEDILEATREKLEELGYKALVASGGEAAIEILGNPDIHIDLVLLDIVMPGMSGLEVYQFIRQNDMNTRVLICSGKDVSQVSSLLEGVQVIRKPFNFDDLAQRIRQLLGPARREPLRSSINRVKCYYVREDTLHYNEVVDDPETIHRLFRQMANEPREQFLAVFLDSQRRIIAYDTLSQGTTNQAAVYPKEIVRSAMLTNASFVILIHNHPSGDLAPSRNDIVISAAIMQACNLIDVVVVDHLIISSSGYLSLQKEGLMSLEG